ncbi:MAG TPA: cytoplasmic filament protein CfpA, partial [Treponemataceae bacterium]|nr:cytoplasmic filament protein CfpA [Treponemataceae bacterium]
RFDYQYPIERRVMEERLAYLEAEFNKFDYMINPFHIQPGLLMDIDITSIKRKKATLDGMANVLNEFLHGVSKGFQDAAFASFSRRRSTVRVDLTQSFAQTPADEHGEEASSGNDLLAELNQDALPPASTAKKAPAKKATAKKGAVDSSRSRRTR